MIEFFDGPAKGTKLNLKNTPVCLRVVINKNGIVDALDQKEDAPRSDESVYAYRIIDGTDITTFLCGGKKGCCINKSALYKMVKDQPSDEVMRNLGIWIDWVEEKERDLTKIY
jgi:hypothetical protein